VGARRAIWKNYRLAQFAAQMCLRRFITSKASDAMRVANGRNRTGSHTRKLNTVSIAKSAVFGLSIETGFIALGNAGNPSLPSLLFSTAHSAA
jgi:hypothetical protein